MREVLELLEADSRLTPQEIADRLGMGAEEVEAIIAEARASRILMGYSAVVNWEQTSTPHVYAFISVSASPEHGTGFDGIADYVSKFDEVHSVYLMSGAFDLQVVVEGDDFRDVARFVAEKLAPIPGVTGTATSFVLKTYKLEGLPAQESQPDDRLAVTP